MELNTTKEDMLERFKLYGEIYCTLATMPGNDYMDDVRIDASEIYDELDIDSDELILISVRRKENWTVSSLIMI